MSATETITRTTSTLEASAPNYSGDIDDAKIHFFVPPADGSTAYGYVEKQPEGVAQTNYTTEEVGVKIRDIRSQPPNTFSLDKNAFEVHESHDSPDVDFWNDESVREKYYPEVEQLIKNKIPNTSKVILFDHTVRRQDPNAHRAPVLRAHVDQTKRSGEWRVKLHVEDPEEAKKLLAGRYRIVNVWRPINGPVETAPLAVGDSGTTADDFVHPIEHRYPHRTGETAGISYSKDTQWWYLSHMKPTERLFLQCLDTVSGTRVPHTAFLDPRSTDKSRPRESIEVRALVFNDA